MQIGPCGRAKYHLLAQGSLGLNMGYSASAYHFLLLPVELPLAGRNLLVGVRWQQNRVHDMAKETLVMRQTRVQLVVKSFVGPDKHAVTHLLNKTAKD